MTPDEQTVERVAKAICCPSGCRKDSGTRDICFHTANIGPARAAISAMPDTTQARNDALREALSHKWLCFHKCDVEIEVVNAEDIIALIKGATNE
tara:strand:- start:14504 stop:14788 length:285 start_codon:yes stop_codon:yes gene_type:complete